MNRKLILSAAVATALALPACSSDDDDDVPGEAAPSGENQLPGEEVEGGEGETSAPAPGSENEEPVLDSEPSGNDTSAIAGLWNADSDAPEARVDRLFVDISADGLYTEYDDESDALGSGENCYTVTPRRLDLETGEAANGTYSASLLGSFTLVLEADGTLTITPFDEDGGPGEASRALVWEPAAEGTVVANLQACEG